LGSDEGQYDGVVRGPRRWPRRHHYRLFCRLDYDAEDQPKPLLVVICGPDKPFRTELSDADYRQVRDLGE
jgi:hypothetical protein